MTDPNYETVLPDGPVDMDAVRPVWRVQGSLATPDGNAIDFDIYSPGDDDQTEPDPGSLFACIIARLGWGGRSVV